MWSFLENLSLEELRPDGDLNSEDQRRGVLRRKKAEDIFEEVRR